MTTRQASLRKLFSVVLATLLLVAAAPAVAGDLELMGALWVGESGGLLKINGSSLTLDLEIPYAQGVSAVAVDPARRMVWAYVEPDLVALDFAGQQILSVPIPTTGTTARLVVRPSDGSVWLSVDTDFYNVSTSGSILTTSTLPDVAIDIEIFQSSVLWVASPNAVTAHDAVTGAQIGSVDDIGNRPKVKDIAVYNSTLWVGLTPGPRQYTIDGTGTATFQQDFRINGLIQIDQAVDVRAWALTSDELVEVRLATFNTGLTSHGDPFPGAEGMIALVTFGDFSELFIGSDAGGIAHLFYETAPDHVQGLPPMAIRDFATFPRELVPPTLVITSPLENGWVGTLRPTITLTYSDDESGVDPSTLSVTSGYACTTSATGAQCTSTLDRIESTHLFDASVRDFAGHTATAQRFFSVDVTPPTISVTSPVSGTTTTDPLLPIEVSYSDGLSGVQTSTLAIQADGVDVPVSCTATASSATCTPTQGLPSGLIVLTASIEDLAGNISISPPVDITVGPPGPPVLEIAFPSGGALIPDPQPRIVLLYEVGQSQVDPATLSLQKDGLELQRQCTFGAERAHCVLLAPLPEGPVTLTATVADLTGATSEAAVRSFTVIPAETTVFGTVLDSGGAPAVGVEVTVVGAGTTVTASDGTFSIPAVPISTGQTLGVVARTGLGEGAQVAGVQGLAPGAGGTTDAGTLTLQPLCVPLLGGGFDATTGVDLTGTSSQPDIRALRVHDDGAGPALYVGGTFNLAGGSPVSNLARFDGATWSDVGGGIFGTVRALEVFDDGTGPQLYVAGDFFQAGGSGGLSVSNIARWDGQTWSAVGAGTNAVVYALEVYDDGTGPALYVGGDFTSAGGATANNLARWDGLSWSEVGAGVNGDVQALLVADLGSGPELVVGGDFSTAGGLAADHIAVWNGTSWAALGAGPGAAVRSLALHDDGTGSALYAGSVLFVSRWDGLQWLRVGPSTAPVSAADVLLSHDDGAGPALYAGSSNVGGLLRWDGVSWGGVGGGISGFVLALAAFDDLGSGFPVSLFVGGRFDRAGGLPSQSLAKWYRECGPIDRTPPQIQLTAPEPGSATSLSQVTFSGSLSEPAALTLDGTAVTVDAGLQFTHGPVSLVPGLNSFELLATDSAGNEARLAAQVYQDGSPPEIAFQSPLAGETVDLARPRIDLVHSDDLGIDPSSLELRLGGSPLGVDCETFLDRSRCRPLADLPSGLVSLTATVRDRAGNLSPTASLSFTVAPAVTLGTTTVIGRVQLPGGVPVAGARVAVLGHPGSSTSTAADGTFSIPGLEVLASDSLTVTASFVDANGGLFGVVPGVVPVLSGVTDVGTLELKPLCDLELDSGFDVSIGVDAMYPRKAPDFSDTNYRPHIRAMEVFDDGTGPALYVAGNFLVAGGVPARNIARWDGTTWSAVGTNVRGGGFDSRAQALTVFDDGSGPALYAGGFFSSADGTPADNLAKWDGTAWTGVTTILGGGVWALEAFDDGGGTALFVGGNFWSVDGVSVANIARWDGSVWTPLTDGLGNSFDTVFTLAGDPGKGQTKLYAGGDFIRSGTTPMYRIAAWDGSAWSDLDLGVQTDSTGLTTVSSLAFFKGDLYVGGFFGNVGSSQLESKGVARWTGQSWSAVPGLSSGGFLLFGTPLGVQALEVFDDGSGEALYALGAIIGSVTGIWHAARWDGTSWSAVGEGVDANTWGGVALAVFDDDPADGVPARLYAGADFRFAEGYGANQIAAWDGQRWLPLGSGLVQQVEALTVTRENGRDVLYTATSASLSRWDGEELVQIPPPLFFEIEALAIHDDGGGAALYAGGDFDTTGPWTTNGVVRWNGTSWEPLGDGLDTAARVFALSEYDDGSGPALIAAGNFFTSGLVPIRSIARWDGSSWSGLSTGIAGGFVFALTVFDDGSGPSLIAGGAFDTAGGGPVNRIARWDGARWLPLGAGFSSTVSALAVYDDGSGPALYAGGIFTTSGTTSVSGIARWDGSAWQPLGSGVNGTVTAMTVWDDGSGPALYVAGVFTSAGGTTANRLAKWDGAVWSAVGSDLDVQIIGKTSNCGRCRLPAVTSLAVLDDGSGPALYVGGQFAHGTFGIREAFGFLDDGGEVEYLARLHRPLECPLADSVPPTVAFTQPVAGSVVSTDLPEIVLSYSDSGSGVDVSTLVVEKDGVPIALDCTLGAFEATCTPLQALAEGPVTLTATVADVAGNLSAPALVSFTVSLGAPVIQFTSPLDGEVVGTATPPVTVTYTPNADPSTLVLQSQPVAVSFTCAPGATSASCTLGGPLAEGLNTLTATVEDGLGLLSAPATVQITVDTLAPTLTLTAPVEGSIVASAQPRIDLDYADSGAGIDTSSLALLLDGAPLAATCTFLSTGAECLPDAPVADGLHTVQATVADLSGKVSAPDQVSFTIDTSDLVPPVITVTSPVTGSVTTVAQTSFVGSLDEPGTLTLDGDPVVLDAANAFDHPVTLTEGWNHFLLVATDLVGNQSQQEVRVLLDTTAPGLAILQPLDGSFFDPAIDPVELRIGDRGAGVDTASLQIEANGVAHGATCTFCSTGATCTLDPLIDTVVTLIVTVRDLAGNTSAAQARFTSDPALDITPPVISVIAPTSGSLTNASEVRFIGQLSESASLTLDGSPVAVAADLIFDHGPVPLVEGLNSFVLVATDAGGNVASETVNVTRDSIDPAAVDTSRVTAVAGSGGFTTVTGSTGAVADTDPGTVVVVRTRLTRAEARLPVSADGSFTGNAAALAGDELELQVEDPAGNTSVPSTIQVPGTPSLPPDPAAVAPTIDPTATTDLCTATAFLYSGTDPVQTGVTPGAVDCERVVWLRGRVLDPAGAPLSGARVSVESQDELGSTRTRTDGAFDLVAHGGGILTVRYAMAGRLVAQRRVEVGFGQTQALPDVVLVATDTQSTTIDLSAPVAFQVARATAVTDASGARQASLLVPPQAPAELVFEDGQRQPISTLTVRATEYTVGTSGPQAMPALLPATSGYTYAVEFSVDEAEAAGAGRVEFSTPVISYTENFLSIPSGTIIPVGYLDRERGVWVPSEDGRVIAILSVTGGLADLDLDGSGLAADATALAALGITDSERQQLASLYLPGQSLWRVRVSHFTPYDYNLPYRSRFGPPGLNPRGGDWDLIDIDCVQGGSIIECTNLILGEDLGIAGTSMALHYRSNRVPGRAVARTLEVPLSGSTVAAELQGIELEIEVAGQKFFQAFPALPDQSHVFTWDGKDGFGRDLQGRHEATTRLTYLYDGEYTAPENCDPCFGDTGGSTPIAPTRIPVRQTAEESRTLGVWDALESLRLGGWTLSPHHVYDPIDRVLHLGTGERRTIRNAKTIQRVAGGLAGDSGDGGPAENAQFTQPTAVEVAPPVETAANPEGGGYYVLDRGNCRVRQVKGDGTVVAVAGAGCGKGVVAEDIPATEAKIARPRGLTVTPDGDLYIADWGDPAGTTQYIWRVEPESGKIFIADSTPASFPRGMTTDEQGYLYYCGDTTPTQIWRVELDGSRTLVAGGGSILNQDDIPSKEAFLGACADLAFNPKQDQLYLVEEGFNWVRRITFDGLVQRVAGTGSADFLGDGGPARDAALNLPGGIDFQPDGTLLIADSENHRIRAVSPDGFIFTMAGSGGTGATGGGSSGDEGPPTQAQLHQPTDVAVTPEGDVLIADQLNNRVRSTGPAQAGRVVLGQEIQIPSRDGEAVYVFDDRGRHLRTEDSRTGEVLLQFGYQDFGGRNLLVSVTDAYGNTTTLERNATTGDPTGILAPFGQHTVLTLHPSGYLATVSSPANETVSLTYSADGLLTGLTDPKMGDYLFEYDTLGRLSKDTDPAGSFTSLSRTDTATGFTVTKSTNLGRSTVFRVENLPGDVERRTTTLPTGVMASVDIGPDGNRTTTYADGSTVTVKPSSDPRLGLLAPKVSTMILTTPGGLSQVTTSSSQVTAVNSVTGEPAEVTDTVTLNGRPATSVRNLLTRTTTTTSPGGRVGSSSFDLFGRIAQSQSGSFTPVSYSYDPQGRLSTVTQGTRTVTYTYDPQGRVETITDPMSRVMRFEYDLAGRVTKQILPDLREILFSYDANGNMTSITPPSRPAHSFSYKANDLPERYTPPDLGPGDESSLLTYNLDRQITQVARPDGKTIDYTYDPTSGRLTMITTPRGGFGFTYDPTTGQVTTISDPELGTLAFTYDGPLLLSTSWTGAVTGSVEQSYNFDFQVTSQTVNGLNPVAFTYGADGEVTQAGDLTLTYDPVAALVTDTTLGAVTDHLTYDSFGDLATYSASFGGGEVYATTYTRDDLGRITQKVETVEGVSHTFDYTYDAAGRLKRVDRDGVLWAEYTWDGNSNRLTATDPLGSFSGTYDDHDRLLTYGSASYTYTANGELASKTVGAATATYEYDVLRQLRKVVKADGITVEYGTDAAGRRVSQSIDGVKVQGFLYGGGLNPVVELDGAGAVVSRFVYGASGHVPDYLLKGGSTYRLITDDLGSVRLVVDTSSGAVAQRLDYDPFGQVLLDTNPGFQPFGFAGGLYDFRTGLVRFGARDYDPQTGRWTTKDPIGFAGGDTNLYGYVLGDPINFIDPEGKFLWVAAGALIGGVVNLGAAVIANGGFEGLTTGQLVAAFAGGAIAGAVGALAGPLGGTIARGLGFSSRGLLASTMAGVVSGVGGALGQLAANVIDPCHQANVTNAALWSGVGGGLAKALIPTNNLNTLRQAINFGPRHLKGLFMTRNAWLNLGAFGTSAGLGAAANWPSLGPIPEATY